MLSIYDKTILNFWDRRKIKKLKQQFSMYRNYSAHAKAEMIRAKYGYSGGPDGNRFIPLNCCRLSCCYAKYTK